MEACLFPTLWRVPPVKIRHLRLKLLFLLIPVNFRSFALDSPPGSGISTVDSVNTICPKHDCIIAPYFLGQVIFGAAT